MESSITLHKLCKERLKDKNNIILFLRKQISNLENKLAQLNKDNSELHCVVASLRLLAEETEQKHSEELQRKDEEASRLRQALQNSISVNNSLTSRDAILFEFCKN